jgi:hypothetical protein
METRNWIIAIACATLIVACSLLAIGWKGIAEDARAAEQACIASQQVRVYTLPRIELGANLTYRNRVLGPTSQFADDSPMFKIDELFDEMDRQNAVKHPCEPYMICLDHLVTLRFDDADIRIVRKVVTTAWAAGFDVVLRPQNEQRSW